MALVLECKKCHIDFVPEVGAKNYDICYECSGVPGDVIYMESIRKKGRYARKANNGRNNPYQHEYSKSGYYYHEFHNWLAGWYNLKD